ncbi:MAG: hypothetical protein ACI388_07925 [Methanobrevibacter sp.]|uniref:hypothetical protein n=1 Tax=Methanobrevibacter sp. TaxID=66852 RepID=UPI003D7CB2B2
MKRQFQDDFHKFDRSVKMTKEIDNLPVKAGLLREKFRNRSPEEQLRFFMNVVEQKAELEAYKEVFGDIKEASL